MKCTPIFLVSFANFPAQINCRPFFFSSPPSATSTIFYPLLHLLDLCFLPHILVVRARANFIPQRCTLHLRTFAASWFLYTVPFQSAVNLAPLLFHF